MESLTLTMLIVTVIGFICILITPKSYSEPAAASWECQTCGAGNVSIAPHCSECGMDR